MVLRFLARIDSEYRFLLLKLQTEFVLDTIDPVEITTRLESLPKDLTEAYTAVLERMRHGDATFAYRILGWIFHSQRILKMSELQEALAIKIGVPVLLPHLITDASKIVSVCGGLVDHDKESDSVTFSHETVWPVLKNMLGVLPSHSEICRMSLTYLQLPPFKTPFELDESLPPGDPDCFFATFIFNGVAVDFRMDLRDFKFSQYAANYWAKHALQSEGSIDLETAILQTFASEKSRAAIGLARRTPDQFNLTHKTLLQLIIENRLTLIFTSPGSREPFQSTYCGPFLNLAKLKPGQRNFGRDGQRTGWLAWSYGFAFCSGVWGRFSRSLVAGE
jgi:hypothetical protein